jgi:hypothetical protein
VQFISEALSRLRIGLTARRRQNELSAGIDQLRPSLYWQGILLGDGAGCTDMTLETPGYLECAFGLMEARGPYRRWVDWEAVRAADYLEAAGA